MNTYMCLISFRGKGGGSALKVRYFEIEAQSKKMVAPACIAAAKKYQATHKEELGETITSIFVSRLKDGTPVDYYPATHLRSILNKGIFVVPAQKDADVKTYALVEPLDETIDEHVTLNIPSEDKPKQSNLPIPAGSLPDHSNIFSVAFLETIAAAGSFWKAVGGNKK